VRRHCRPSTELVNAHPDFDGLAGEGAVDGSDDEGHDAMADRRLDATLA
jgi:hypothetical protein